MNIYKALNELTEYIDNHLEEKIDYKKLARILGVNTYTMQRIFSLLTNITLADYIRKRRLSSAGEDLYKEKIKVMDLAMKYGYDNATSFSRAFEAFHGIKPSRVTTKTNLKIFPRIILEEKNKSLEPISYEIIEMDSMVLYGTYIKTNNKIIKKDAPNFFAQTEKKYAAYGNVNYAMVTYEDEERLECNAYWVLYTKPIPNLKKITIPKNKWLKFKINSQETIDIQRISTQFYMEFLPSCKYNIANLPELEYYHDNKTDFLVPLT